MHNIYILKSLYIDSAGAVACKNVGVTFSIHQAESHRAKGVEHEFESFPVHPGWLEDAETSQLVMAMREYRELIKIFQDEALK